MERHRLVVTGTVQGVGFRPFVRRLADRLQLTGLVRNDGRGAWCEIQGPAGALDEFAWCLERDAPPLALIEHVEVRQITTVADETSFVIAGSEIDQGGAALAVPPDVAPCRACLAEIARPGDRRRGYAFTCCTDCGPRYSVVRELPYDRERTSMEPFPLCVRCQAEYHDPADRRHHAQATCCPTCGPSLSLTSAGHVVPGDPIVVAAEQIRRGQIVAVKGVGGYQLVCRADDERTVRSLRARKRREEKPFALLARDIEAAARLVDLNAVAVAALAGPEAPIVLADRRPGAPVAPSVAPDTHVLGVMLPASPLHALLADAAGPTPLVCTSGNTSDEPIVIDDARVTTELGSICDLVLTHDRRIERRADDSVGHVVAGDFQLLRRARGFAPRPVRLDRGGPTVLAVGAELKSSVCIAIGHAAHLSVHLGDLEHPAAIQAFESAIADLLSISRAVPELVLHDLHPEYLSTKFAATADLAPAMAVQHHHAHLASCLADNGHHGRAIGVSFDGLGWGADGTLWGGEFLVGDATAYERAAHLAPVPMPGGGAAIQEPWRMAVSYLHGAFSGELPDLPVLQRHDDDVGAVASLCAAGHSLTTSSVGRLFDAIAAMCDLGDVVTHEGQAAVRLEQASGPTDARYAVGVTDASPRLITVNDLVERVGSDVLAGTDVAIIAGAFHRWVADMIVELATSIGEVQDMRTVALSGGVFQNRLLVELVLPRLSDRGFRVLRHRQVPPNDGGISLGQVAVGRAALASGRYG